VHRSIYAEEHELFRKAVRSFLQKEIAPDYSNWALHGGPPREIWRRAGELGILGIQVPEEFGGAGVASFKFNTILGEEPQAACLPLGGFRAHMDIVLPYLLEYATPEQKRRWLPGVATGETILAIGMTEPGAGSDVAGITTTAVRQGDEYVINGAKTFISNGISADLIVLAVKTDPAARRQGISLIAVEGDRPGVGRGRNLDKIGLHSQDTGELSFTDVRVPVENLLGTEGQGFVYLTSKPSPGAALHRRVGAGRSRRRCGIHHRIREEPQSLRIDDRQLSEHQVRVGCVRHGGPHRPGSDRLGHRVARPR
jgi:acyl-CoA dehydrogenase